MKISQKERFERHIVMIPEAGCWIWTASLRNDFGYGGFKLTNGKKVHYAHRASWELYVGPIPSGMSVLHRCDIPACVNPHHLFLGTQADNSNDMVQKKRQVKGILVPQAKITDQIALAIKMHPYRPARVLAEMFGISRKAVSDILNGRTWKHVGVAG